SRGDRGHQIMKSWRLRGAMEVANLNSVPLNKSKDLSCLPQMTNHRTQNSEPREV
uniref:Uncharacterized protein n=1 Tax=Parascaris univalens TaxID=6257 RepID=A0A915C3B0_PARUN